MMTTLYGWGPMFGIQSPSPFVAKADIHIQMFDMPCDRATADLESVSKHKAPYVEDDGVIIEDSTFIRWHFEKKLGVDLDEGLTQEQRAITWALERMLEDRLTPIMANERWLQADNFARGPALFFLGVPEAMRAEVIAGALSSFETGHQLSGIGRHSREERMQLAAKDISAVAAILGSKPFVMADYPTAVDAVVYGAIAGCTAPIFDTPLKDLVASHANLVAFLKRMEDRFYTEERWPSMTPEIETT